MNRDRPLEPYLTHVKKLPFVQGVTVALEPKGEAQARADALIRLRTEEGEFKLWVELKRTHLTHPVVENILGRIARHDRQMWLLFAPHVGREMGRLLREHGLNYVDRAGNCHLHLGPRYLAQIEGRRPEMAPRDRGVRGPGYQIVFTLLAKPELLGAPVRVLADAAGVGKTAAADMVNRLIEEGLVGADRDRRRLLRVQTLRDRWLSGYATTVRPRLLIGRFQTQDPNPDAREDRLDKELEGVTTKWAWGGGAAAWRLTGLYRGPTTVIHVEHAPPDIARKLRALPAREGHLVILGVPGPVAFEGVKPRTVHPLLVQTELLATGDERAREAAQEIQDRFLEGGAK